MSNYAHQPWFGSELFEGFLFMVVIMATIAVYYVQLSN